MPNQARTIENAAARLLRRIRTGRDHPTATIELIDTLHDNLKRGSLTLEDIGTTKKEIRTLTKRQYERHAIMLLTALRRGSSNVESLLRLLREDLIKSNLKLEDIGTSQQELESFKPSRQTKRCAATL